MPTKLIADSTVKSSEYASEAIYAQFRSSGRRERKSIFISPLPSQTSQSIPLLSVTPTQRKGSQVPFAASVRIAGLSLVRITAVVHKKLTKVVNYSEVDETVSLTKPNCAVTPTPLLENLSPKRE